MSGGSYNYEFYNIEDTYKGKMKDAQLNEMILDLVRLLKDLEWCDSGDTDEEDYKQSVNKFKKKWFYQDSTQVEDFINKQLEEKKQELLECFSYLKEKDNEDNT